MKNKYLKPIMPFSDQMLEILMDYHEREILKQEPLQLESRYAQGLLDRGLLNSCMYINGTKGTKRFIYYITTLGKDYLKKHFRD